MKDEKIGKRIFQKSREVDEEKQQDIVTTDLNIEEDAHLSGREVLVLIAKVIDRKKKVDQKEQSIQRKKDRVGELKVEGQTDNEERRENKYAGDPAKRYEPVDNPVKVCIF